MKVLVLNAGSSSQKSYLYELNHALPDAPPKPLWEAKIDWTRHHDRVEIKIRNQENTFEEERQTDSRSKVLADTLKMLWQGKTQVIDRPEEIDVVGHRVVHGGEVYRATTIINAEVKQAIADLTQLAPAHNAANLDGIEIAEQVVGTAVPQVAVFDTAFHAQLPFAAAAYPVPYEWFEQGLRRYGFHGINHEYCAQRAAQLLGQELSSLKLITCHLGNGCSLAAIREGHSIDTTMGFTPLEGLMMGSRSGSVDPGLLLHLMERGYTAAKLNHILNKESGLKGISGISNDMRQIVEAIAQSHPQAQQAFDLYIHRLRSHIGAMLANLGGVDALIFTGGVGEHQPEIRVEACKALECLGLQIDPEQNEQSPVDQDVATADSKVRVLVIPAQEEWAIAQKCWEVVGKP